MDNFLELRDDPQIYNNSATTLVFAPQRGAPQRATIERSASIREANARCLAQREAGPESRGGTATGCQQIKTSQLHACKRFIFSANAVRIAPGCGMPCLSSLRMRRLRQGGSRRIECEGGLIVLCLDSQEHTRHSCRFLAQLWQLCAIGPDSLWKPCCLKPLD